jgi:sigma-B regulation protein RsbU (phosphoserine phosphatase)
LSGSSPDHNIGIARGPNGPEPRAPAEVASAMNGLLLSEIQTDRYLTLAHAVIDRLTGRVALVQAGHPHPIVQRHTGEISVLGAGGLPIGLFDGARYETFETQLHPGDRLLLVSDGVTECPNPAGEELGHEGLAAILTTLAALPGRQMLDALIWELSRWHGSEDFPDDISCALFEFG